MIPNQDDSTLILRPDEPVSADFPDDEPGVLALFVRDSALQALIGLALLFDVALFAYLLLRLDGLPELLPLHFDASGFPDRIDQKTSILALPAIGLIVIALNVFIGLLAYRRERATTVLLAASALLMQVLLWFALVNIVGGLI